MLGPTGGHHGAQHTVLSHGAFSNPRISSGSDSRVQNIPPPPSPHASVCWRQKPRGHINALKTQLSSIPGPRIRRKQTITPML